MNITNVIYQNYRFGSVEIEAKLRLLSSMPVCMCVHTMLLHCVLISCYSDKKNMHVYVSIAKL